MMYSDHELIAKINAGNLHAFRLLVNMNERLVLSMVRRVIKDEESVKDVCQEVFIKVYKNLKHFKQESRLSTWIAQIAYTTSLDYLKSMMRRQAVTDQVDDYQNKLAGEYHPGHALDQKEMRTFILKMIDQLPENYRLVVSLFHIDDYSYQEIAQITGLSEGTIKSHLFRARKLLKEKLASLV
ncbi:RNA polymerase sigma factor [Parapedobacter koreensis]|uniref:RNA polymerase sigma-70 factor, ECF subfamily n=1 Tax=Parapedobacter koreensis TaxID=332977 RepID=A0A1H7SJH8_9SPHI|nr:sigma-70 family RNA polymerase sigma factor [Parapedobacter koreensis]SEL72618.1 RNA polymerase sigma-70 factor, ECF subfamily [Parapedobacter koreensis]